jgi:hypothetical protein
LSQRGTYAASSAIEKITAAFPNFTWLKRYLKEAREAARRKTWTPPRAQDLIALAQERQRRFVQNGDQLLNVVVESLQRLDSKLQGETPPLLSYGINNPTGNCDRKMKTNCPIL